MRDAYWDEKEIAFHEGQAGMAVPLEPGWFAVLFPADAHKPGCLASAAVPALVRKCVIKVPV